MIYYRTEQQLHDEYNDITELCKKTKCPVYIGEDGKEDIVVLSASEFERITGRDKLYAALEEGLEAVRKGNVRPAKEVFDEIFGMIDDIEVEQLKGNENLQDRYIGKRRA